MEVEMLMKWLGTEVNDASGEKTTLLNLFFNLRFKAYLIRKFILDRPTMANALKNLPYWIKANLTQGDMLKSDEKKNLETLFSNIYELDDDTLKALNYYYNEKYNWEIFTPKEKRGGRKLSHRRKSNAKSKLKHNKRRRSFKKSSHRRQRH
jgi:hypothetical protein